MLSFTFQVAGIFEGWVSQLVSALLEREPSANVIVVDWLNLAQHHYPNAAQHSQLAGRDVAALINWLEVGEISCNPNWFRIGNKCRYFSE